ncbi:hypothetical protein [Larkinella sp.]|uniref:hypothetical protein n=1 Tax=Larkinella sp. TaxID=2034517 RepID=UPI003BAD9190
MTHPYGIVFGFSCDTVSTKWPIETAHFVEIARAYPEMNPVGMAHFVETRAFIQGMNPVGMVHFVEQHSENQPIP